MSSLQMAERIERALDMIGAALLAVMVTSIAIQVAGRYIFHYTPNWTEEVARFSLVWMTMLTSAAALRQGGHLAVTTLLQVVPPRVREALMVVRDLAILSTVGTLAWAGWHFALMNAEQDSPALDIPMTVPYASLVVGAALMTLLLALSRLSGQPIPSTEAIDGSV